MDNKAALLTLIEDALKDSDIGGDERAELVKLAFEEAASCTDGEADLGDMLKNIRLSGEMPLYFSKIIALALSAKNIKPGEIKDAVEKEYGLRFERETIELIAEAYLDLPKLGLDEKSRKKAEIMKLAHRKGYEFEKVYKGCAQCTLAAVSEVTGKIDDAIFRAANGFAGGMAAMGDGACGGYSGGMMSLGMFAGRRREFFDGDKEEKDLIVILTQELREKFIQTYGSVICHGIHNQIFGRAFTISLPEDKEAFELAGAHDKDKCPAVVGMASAWTAGILFDHGLIGGEVNGK